MKGIFIFIGGFVVGIIFTIFILFIFAAGRTNQGGTEMEVQYIDIKGKKGNVTLYTGMPKDSVLILVGKPEEVRLHSLGNTTYETWGYKLKNKYISDLDIDFEDGRLEGVRQN